MARQAVVAKRLRDGVGLSGAQRAVVTSCAIASRGCQTWDGKGS